MPSMPVTIPALKRLDVKGKIVNGVKNGFSASPPKTPLQIKMAEEEIRSVELRRGSGGSIGSSDRHSAASDSDASSLNRDWAVR